MCQHEVSLICWSCGKKIATQVDRVPRFSFELVQLANDNGMYGVFDLQNNRSLVFCSENCASNQMTKTGGYRKVPKRAVCK